MTTPTLTSVPPAKQVTPAGLVHELIAHQWSPYGFAERPVQNSDLDSLFEAARWAASSYKDQTWTYFVASQTAPEEFEQLLSCLVPANQQWAKAAPVLVLSIVSLRLSKINQDNRAAVHDLGQASANLALEATSRGLSVHQVMGIFPDRARKLYQIPEHFEAWTAMALGYQESAERRPEALRPRDRVPRTRQPTRAFAFRGPRGNPSAAQSNRV